MSLFVKLVIPCMLENVVFSSLCVCVGVSDQFAISGVCKTDNEVQQRLKSTSLQMYAFDCWVPLKEEEQQHPVLGLYCVCVLSRAACVPPSSEAARDL